MKKLKLNSQKHNFSSLQSTVVSYLNVQFFVSTSDLVASFATTVSIQFLINFFNCFYMKICVIFFLFTLINLYALHSRLQSKLLLFQCSISFVQFVYCLFINIFFPLSRLIYTQFEWIYKQVNKYRKMIMLNGQTWCDLRRLVNGMIICTKTDKDFYLDRVILQNRMYFC